MAKPVRIGGAAPGSVQGAAEFQAFLRGYAPEVRAKTVQVLDEAADKMVAVIREAAPVSPLEAHPGDLRASVHAEPGRNDLSVVVVVDAVDALGVVYPAHVEYGHGTPDGVHVPPHPFFWPAVRGSRRKIAAGIRKALRDAALGRT